MVEIQSIGLEKEDSVITMNCFFKNHQARLILDTGATQTIIDKNFLIIIGYDLFSPIDVKEFETAGGIITAEKHIIYDFKLWDMFFEELTIFTYDFLEIGLITDLKAP
jgi:hypothetical protein